MNKFKFGDKVWHETLGECSVLTLDDEIDNIYKIVYLDRNEDYIAYAHGSKLTLVSDWVKCSERLPEEGQSVTLYDGDSMWIDITYDFGDGLCFYYDDDGRATHWMPLPAPPMEVAND